MLREQVEKDFGEAVSLPTVFDFLSPSILNVEHINNSVSEGRYPCKVDGTSVVRQGLSQIIEDAHSILAGDFENGIKIRILIMDFHLDGNARDDPPQGGTG